MIYQTCNHPEWVRRTIWGVFLSGWECKVCEEPMSLDNMIVYRKLCEIERLLKEKTCDR